MTSRLGDRLEKVERVIGERPLHFIVCENMAEVAEAKRFLGDRFGDLIFVATGVRESRTGTDRREQWLFQARHNSCSRPYYGAGWRYGGDTSHGRPSKQTGSIVIKPLERLVPQR